MAIEADKAGGIENIDSAGWQRVGLAGGAGFLGGGAATAIGTLATAGGRMAATIAAGATISAGHKAASVSLQDNRAPSAGELGAAAKVGGETAMLGGSMAEAARIGGPVTTPVAANAPAAVKRLADSLTETTNSAVSAVEAKAATLTRTAGELAGAMVDAFGNSSLPQPSAAKPQCKTTDSKVTCD